MLRNFETVKLTIEAGAATLTLARPPLNILNRQMMREVNEALVSIAQLPDCQLVLLVNEGKAFSAGVDVVEHKAPVVEAMLKDFHQLLRTLVTLPFPSLAVVDGTALGGGCELALSCDFIIATQHSRFGQPEIQVGVFPPVAVAWFGLWYPTRAVNEMILTGRVFSATEMLEAGFLNAVVPAEKLAATVTDWKAHFQKLSSAILRQTRKAMRAGDTATLFKRLEEAEQVYLRDLMQTEDATEGLNAFLEKRAPVWRNA